MFVRVTRKRVAVVIAIVVLAGAGGVAYASALADTNVFTACKLNVTGTIRLIDSALPSTSLLSHCTAFETAISWNKQGIPGANGLDGKDGATGAQGPKGDPGAPKTISVYTVGDSRGVRCCGFGQGTELYVYCGAGDSAVGGGFDRSDVDVKVSRPTFDNAGWYVVADGGVSGGNVQAYAKCLHVTSG